MPSTLRGWSATARTVVRTSVMRVLLTPASGNGRRGGRRGVQRVGVLHGTEAEVFLADLVGGDHGLAAGQQLDGLGLRQLRAPGQLARVHRHPASTRQLVADRVLDGVDVVLER